MLYKILITGGRDFKDVVYVANVVDIFVFGGPFRELDTVDKSNLLVIHGGAKGVDLLADKACKKMGIHTAQIDALWDTFGRRAGPMRNNMMALLDPHYCLAFPGGVGTRNMVSNCVSRNIPVTHATSVLSVSEIRK